MNVKASDPKAGRLQIFASYIYPHRKLFAIDMTLSVMIALTDLVFPYVSRWSMHHLLPEKMFQAFLNLEPIVSLIWIHSILNFS